MKLRTKLIAWFSALHLVMAATAALVLYQRPVLLFAAEALFVVSIAISVRLVRAFFVPFDLITTGAELMREGDFSVRFARTGQPEMDALVDVYNGMIEQLREERLSAQERHHLLQKILDASPTGVVICTFEGRPESFNPAARRLLDDSLTAELQRVPVGESALLQSGVRRLKASRAEFRDRGFIKSFFVVEEMTEELRLTEKRAYEKLIRIMTHEVNNSVGAVRSLLESALRYAPQVGEADRDDYVQALSVASARVDALNRFMSGFADVVKIPSPRRTPVDISAIVEQCVVLFRHECESRHIALRSDLDDPSLRGVDAAQIEQVIVNVLKNAVEAVGRDGEIAISLRSGVLTVHDSGPGLAPEVRSEVFTPFFSTKREGRGLGLTLVQEILSNHALPFSLANGTRGAIFTIDFSSAAASSSPQMM